MASLLEAAVGTKPLIESDKQAVGGGSKYWLAFRAKLEQKLSSLDNFRLSWWTHWAELAKYILPRRYHWLITANKTNRGFPINQNIVDETGTIAARNLASGLLAGMASPTRPWFVYAIGNAKLMERKEVKLWLAAVQDIMYDALKGSNFYDAMGVMYFDLVIFGTAVVIIYDDPKTIIRCYNPCAGEYYLGSSARLTNDTLNRKFTFTINQIVEMFGLESCDAEIKSSFEAKGASGESERVVAHSIEPNTPLLDDEGEAYYPVPKKFQFRETYWIWGASNEKPLAMKGYNEQPFISPRWDVTSNDPYGRSVGMDGLAAIMQLQFEQKRKAEGIEKEVRPPMTADVSLKNEPTSTVAGGITYVPNIGKFEGFKPTYQVTPKLDNLTKDIAELQTRIKNIFFNDLLLMISQLDTVRTATEIDARREEKMLMLGPVIERNQGEALGPALERIHAILDRKNAFPPPPAIIRGMNIQVKYVSMLAIAQRASETAGIERFFQFTGNIGAAIPDAFDNVDVDEGIRVYGDRLHVPPSIIRDAKEAAQQRQDRQQKQQQSQALQESMAAAEGAKTLSETNVGGGQNALQRMMGG